MIRLQRGADGGPGGAQRAQRGVLRAAGRGVVAARRVDEDLDGAPRRGRQ